MTQKEGLASIDREGYWEREGCQTTNGCYYKGGLDGLTFIFACKENECRCIYITNTWPSLIQNSGDLKLVKTHADQKPIKLTYKYVRKWQRQLPMH